ncbi:MAG: peptidase C39 family protein [Candidatus Thermoplasmatota archaeon]|nr:peptidase C39 family protein [Candidatus Thermoplasmatota archaeon]MBU1941265.1 peptidase C39 family protein [Candidatus Thermoplasmatota archaeon]
MTESMVLDVPYYQQTRYATCGPAALMMVMRFFDASVVLSKNLEFRLWKQSRSLRYFGATLPSGLALTAAHLGYIVMYDQLIHATDVYPKIFLFSDRTEQRFEKEAQTMGITIHYGREQYSMLQDALKKGVPPIVLVRLMPLVQENVLHWVVVTGMSDKRVYVNDPYVPLNSSDTEKKNVPIPHELFREALATDINKGFRLPPTILTVYK